MTTDGFSFGPWTVQPKLNRISGEAGNEQVEPRLMRVLELLARIPGEVVSREELLDRVWGDVVVGEETVTVAISQLRRILGDDVRQPLYIETIRKGGYRLVASVRPLDAPSLADASPSDRSDFEPPRPVPSRLRRWIPAAAVVIGIAFVVGWGAARFAQRGNAEHQEPRLLQAVPLTSESGSERYPVVAPDGARVAYCQKGDVYVTQRGASRPLQLTDHPDPELFPTWSPDGDRVAFIRSGATDVTIQIVSALGGVTEELVRLEPLVAGLDWSPDGRWLAVSTSTDPELPYLIALVDSTTGELTQLTKPQPEFSCDSWPRFSPDGHQVAFVRAGWGAQQDLFVIAVAGGGCRRVAERLGVIHGLDWDGSNSLVFAGAASGVPRLTRIDIGNGQMINLPIAGVDAASFPSFAAGTLAFEQVRFDRDVWELPLDGDKLPRRVIDSTRVDEHAVISPDGRTIVFVSLRTGHRELWLCARDGSDPWQLTSMNDTQVLQPGWSPGGRRIAFTAVQDGHSAVHVVERTGGPPRRLTAADSDHSEIFSTWSEDGDWLYFAREQAKRWELWRMRIDGSGQRLVTVNGLQALADTPSALVYLSPSGPTVWRLRHSDGAIELLADADLLGTWLRFAANRHQLVAIAYNGEDARAQRLDLSSGQLDELGPLPFVGGFSLAPDGRSLLIERDDGNEHDLMLVRLAD